MRVPRRLDKLVASGRLSAEEANRLRSGEPREIEETVIGIRVRHAGARLEAAVAAGEISQAEADAVLDRLRLGDHSAEVRARINRLGTPGSAVARRPAEGARTGRGGHR